MIGYIIGGVVVLAIALIGVYINIFNKIQTYENRIDEAFAQIDVQLKKRFDLVPNLVETVKGYASHEKEIFENVSKARAGLMGGNMQDRVQANNMLTQALGRLFAVAEAYPELKAQEGFRLLQEQLEGIENKIAYSRQYYNQSVLTYNNLVSTIPGVWFAGGRKEKPFLEIPEVQREAPQVKF